jgi:nucleotide-binding universal stress UspA family protein
VTFNKILLTLDGSELARRALPFVRDLARGSDTEVCVLEVIDPLESVVFQLGAEGIDPHSAEGRQIEERALTLQAVQRDAAKQDLEEAKRELEHGGVSLVTTLIAEGRPAEAIVEAAGRLGCDAIAMGARGHSGLRREAIGSVAEALVLNATTSAVIVVGPRAPGPHGPTVFGAHTISPAPELRPQATDETP